MPSRAGRAAGVAGGVGQHRCRDRGTATRGGRCGASPRPRTSCRSISSISASRRARSSRARLLASYDAATERITLRVELPDADRIARRPVQRGARHPADKVRVLVGDVGGGFGMKTSLYPEDVVARALRAQAQAAAQVVRRAHRGIPGGDARPRPDAARRSSRSTRSGRILALRVASLRQPRRLRDAGRRRHPADDRPVGVDQHLRHRHHRHPDPGRAHAHHADRAPYRGAGRPEAIYIIERLMDAAARKTGIDPVELRRRNMIRPSRCRTRTRWTRPTTAASSSW